MAQLGQFDPLAPSPQRIIGWYDTVQFNYPNLPPEDSLVEVPDEQWEARLDDPGGWVNNNGTVQRASD